jgi:hypothetical protein
MAHIRIRHCKGTVNKTLSYSSIVGVFGHRQCGKTTFVETLSQSYFTIDDKEVRAEIKNHPKQFIKDHNDGLLILDECQYEENLFPALKEHVRTHKQPGRFLLTGSVRFSSRKAIRESLTGRLSSVELYPLTTAEIDERPLPEVAVHLNELKIFDSNTLDFISHLGPINQKSFLKYLDCGGLPKICFSRDPTTQVTTLNDLLRLILDRDLRLVVETRLSLETLFEFLRLIAQSAWLPWNSSEIKRRLGLAHQTQIRLLYGMESIYLIRRFHQLGSAGHSFLMEDQFEEKILSGGALPSERYLLSALYRNIRTQFSYQPKGLTSYKSYRTLSGASVPLIVECGEKILGFLIMQDENPNLSEKRSADSFLRKYPNAKVIFVSRHNVKAKLIDTRSLICSIFRLV